MATRHGRATLISCALVWIWGCTDNAQDPPLTATDSSASSSTSSGVATSEPTQESPDPIDSMPGASSAMTQAPATTTPTTAAPASSSSSPESEQGAGGEGRADPEPVPSDPQTAPLASSSAAPDAGAAPNDGPSSADAEAAVQALQAHLDLPRQERPPLGDEGFARVPLDKASAEQVRELLWQDHRAEIEETRREEFDAKVIEQGELRLRYDYTIFGDKPATGRSLFLSLHGGGNADPSVNDEQWENQKGLYQPEEGVYLAPRAPTDTWNLWHEVHIDPMFERLIEDLIVFEDVDPNRVYVMGYSAGGDGVYQLGPRMADHWAAASAMAGHPNEAQPLSLRNIGFTVHVGALDTGYDRNLVAQQWSDRMDELEAADPDGYVHVVQLHEGKEHWMDLEDAVAVPWMAEFTRNPVPTKVVWLQDDITHTRFYWLAVPDEAAAKDALVTAELDGQQIELSVEGTDHVRVRLSDAMLDLDQAVSVSVAGVEHFADVAPRTIFTLWTTLAERGDPALVFDAEIDLEL